MVLPVVLVMVMVVVDELWVGGREGEGPGSNKH